MRQHGRLSGGGARGRGLLWTCLQGQKKVFWSGKSFKRTAAVISVVCTGVTEVAHE